METEVETMKEHCLLACIPWFLRLFSYITQDYLPGSNSTHICLWQLLIKKYLIDIGEYRLVLFLK